MVYGACSVWLSYQWMARDAQTSVQYLVGGRHHMPPPAFPRRPSRGRPPRAPLRRYPTPSCDACPAPANVTRRRAPPPGGTAWPPAAGAAGRKCLLEFLYVRPGCWPPMGAWRWGENLPVEFFSRAPYRPLLSRPFQASAASRSCRRRPSSRSSAALICTMRSATAGADGSSPGTSRGRR